MRSEKKPWVRPVPVLSIAISLMAVSTGMGAAATKKVDRIERPALLWGATKRPDGAPRYWDVTRLTNLGATLVSVYYRPLNDKGERVNAVGMIPPRQLAEILRASRPELDESHKNGIKVIGYADGIMFHPDMLKAEGIDTEELYALDPEGKRVPNSTWDSSGTFVSCVSNLRWTDLQRQVTETTVRAGYDGIMFDAYPYALQPGFMCHCASCKSRWSEYGKRKYGRTLAMPAGATLDFTRLEDRALFEWRQLEYVGFVKTLNAAALRINPEFRLVMNQWADNTDFMYQAMIGGLRFPSTEVGHLKLGEESSLYLYRATESLGGELVTVINDPNQLKPVYRCTAALAEACAGGGTVYALPPSSDADESGQAARKFYRFLQENRQWYEGMKSEARAAILYSWRDNAFAQETRHDRLSVSRQGKGYFRDTATNLSRLGISYDLIACAGGIEYSRLKAYTVVVTPNIALLDDAEAEAIRRFVEEGGTLLAVGDLGTLREDEGRYVPRSKSFLAEYGDPTSIGPWRAEVGKGKIVYSPMDRAAGRLSARIKEAAALAGAVDDIRAVCASDIETTIRSHGRRKALHIIRLGKPGNEAPIELACDLADGRGVKCVKSASPDGEVKVSWEVASGNRLKATITSPHRYILVCLESTEKAVSARHHSPHSGHQ